MIEVDKKRDCWCNACRSQDKNEPVTFIFKFGSNHGFSISLCKNCRQDLENKLKELNKR